MKLEDSGSLAVVEESEPASKNRQSLVDSSSERGSVRAPSLEPQGAASPSSPTKQLVSNDESSIEREDAVDPSLEDVMSLSSDHAEKAAETLSLKSVSMHALVFFIA